MKTASRKHRTVLALQGGGALGAYQAGIYQAMHEHAIEPDWVVGTSIGAINAAIIAGNRLDARVPQLKNFWQKIAHADLIDMERVHDRTRQLNTLLAIMDAVVRGVPGFFSPRLFNLLPFGLSVPADTASFYDNSALAETISELVDFDYVNATDAMRLTVSAVNVTSGKLVNFDSANRTLATAHIMASGALPPGFPAVRIEGNLYWDGGLYSNTPIETILNDAPQTDTLCFMVDLWNPKGPEPTTLNHLHTRQKDVMYASRTQEHIDTYIRTHMLQDTVRELYNRLPNDLKTAKDKAMINKLGCDTTIHVVRLPYGGQDWQMASKDINFSRGSLTWRWKEGYQDAMKAIEKSAWLSYHGTDTGIVVHDMERRPHPEH